MGCWAGGQRSPNNHDNEYDRPNYGTNDNRNSDGMTMVESDDARRCTFTSADVDTFTQTTTANFAVDAIIIRILAATSAIVTSSAIVSTMIFVTNAAHQPSSSTSLAKKKHVQHHTQHNCHQSDRYHAHHSHHRLSCNFPLSGNFYPFKSSFFSGQSLAL